MVKEDVNKLIVITHGLTGGTDCNYIKDTMEKLYKAGFNVVCVNQRGVAYSKLTV
jgi:predicted alpha/beta-fold hydrolase